MKKQTEINFTKISKEQTNALTTIFVLTQKIILS